ncbi:MAG: IS66 family insertion sequence element accessory protein TnpB, partial [Rhodobacteraceae bacterium]|nr:IS66 family insertion sequence element accessory protein TnpB [Paracoccaceae bacterium]
VAMGAVELVLGAGRCVRVGPGFDGPTLTRLLVLLEEGRP